MNANDLAQALLGDQGAIVFALVSLMQVQHLVDEHGMTDKEAAKRLGVPTDKLDELRGMLAGMVDA